MSRYYALALGSLAMAVVMARGALQRENVNDVAVESILALFAFMLIGATAGWIMDYVIRDAVETLFRNRVDWYRKGLIDTGDLKEKPTKAS